MDRNARADTLVRTIRSLGDAALRVAYVAHAARSWDVASVAGALDIVCGRAERAEAAAREALVAIVDALNGVEMEDVVERLRERAAGESLLALSRLLRCPLRGSRAHRPQRVASRAPAGSPLPEGGPKGEGKWRVLTLGERKSLARRPDRDSMQRLIVDSHPDVIRALLRSPRVTEDDVVRLAAKRPGRGEILAEVARCTAWVHRPRVRMALIMNPATVPAISAKIAGLLLRPELQRVARAAGVPAHVRALCLEHLTRRPPLVSSADARKHLH